MSGHCFNCGHWIICRKTVYSDGSEIITSPSSPDGKNECTALGIRTTPEFGCAAHSTGKDHVVVTHKDGTPWSNWEYRPCPDCGGRGSTPEIGMCYRCYGTSRVRFYDDGYIGEERTRLHPKEREALQCTTPQGSDQTVNVPKPGETLAPRPPPDPFAGQVTL